MPIRSTILMKWTNSLIGTYCQRSLTNKQVTALYLLKKLKFNTLLKRQFQAQAIPLVNMTKYLREKNNTKPTQTFPENRKGILPNLCYKAIITLIPKSKYSYHKERKLQSSIPHKH